MVALGKEAPAHDNGELALLGEGVDSGGVLLAIQVDGLGLFGKNHRRVAKVARRHARQAYAAGLDGENLVDGSIGEQARPLGAHVVEQLRIALMVKERIHLQHAPGLDDAVLANTIFKLLHYSVSFPFPTRRLLAAHHPNKRHHKTYGDQRRRNYIDYTVSVQENVRSSRNIRSNAISSGHAHLAVE